MNELGKIGIIANPVSQSGAGSAAAKHFTRMLAQHVPEDEFDLLLTVRGGHATELAKEAADKYQTIIAIGGDGVVHEVANGLMQVPENARPTLGVVPVGSGNDYALTLKMPHDIHKAVERILANNTQLMDVGRVNGEYFVETLSFGLDAAIALDTVERRKATGRKGTILYAESGIDQILHHRVPQVYSAQLCDIAPLGRYMPLDDGDNDTKCTGISGHSYIFAVQIGKTYGGHFVICPDASPTDGYFDICIAHPPLGAVQALAVFAMAKSGKHKNMKKFEFHRAKTLTLDFESTPPAQADGERIEGTHFEIETFHCALNVIQG